MHILDELEIYLSQFLNFEKLPQKNMFWLDTMEFLCAHFGNPQDAMPSVHIAGSKGKGTVSAMIQAIIAEMGFKCGLYASPHVVDFSERINLGKKLFSADDYRRSFDELKRGIDSAAPGLQAANRPLTWFELVTLYAFLIFRDTNCGWAVYETGLGGRLDATNVLKPRASVITVIEKEHTEFLGDTLGAIAKEKAGIIKNRTPVFVAEQTPEAREVFETTAKENGSPFFYIPDICEAEVIESASESESLKNGERVRIASKLFSRPLETTLSMRGSFQADNAALAAVVCKTLFPDISEAVIEAGLSRVALPARFEVIEHPAAFPHIPALVIDGAHTEKSIRYTVQSFERLIPGRAGKIIAEDVPGAQLIFSCAYDKDVETIARYFCAFGDITLTLPGNAKKANPERMRNAFADAGLRFVFNENFIEAITQSLSRADSLRCPVLVTGSFYLAGEVKKTLNVFA